MDAIVAVYGLLAGFGTAVVPLMPLVITGASVAVWRAANAFRRYLNT